MDEALSRAWHELIARDSGPLDIRLFLQPLVATIIAIRSGRRDAAARRPAFFWVIFHGAAGRRTVLQDILREVGKLFIVAAILDTVYQVLVLHWIYPLQTLIVATVLAVLPYLAVRGLTNRILSASRRTNATDEKSVGHDD